MFSLNQSFLVLGASGTDDLAAFKIILLNQVRSIVVLALLSCLLWVGVVRFLVRV